MQFFVKKVGTFFFLTRYVYTIEMEIKYNANSAYNSLCFKRRRIRKLYSNI